MRIVTTYLLAKCVGRDPEHLLYPPEEDHVIALSIRINALSTYTKVVLLSKGKLYSGNQNSI
jgi:hypothetical protein